jgi:hypothetical protein
VDGVCLLGVWGSGGRRDGACPRRNGLVRQCRTACELWGSSELWTSPSQRQPHPTRRRLSSPLSNQPSLFAMVSPQTVRRVVLTGSIAAITLTGTIYGAQLKSDVQTQQVSHPSSPSTVTSHDISSSECKLIMVRGIEKERGDATPTRSPDRAARRSEGTIGAAEERD